MAHFCISCCCCLFVVVLFCFGGSSPCHSVSVKLSSRTHSIGSAQNVYFVRFIKMWHSSLLKIQNAKSDQRSPLIGQTPAINSGEWICAQVYPVYHKHTDSRIRFGTSGNIIQINNIYWAYIYIYAYFGAPAEPKWTQWPSTMGVSFSAL